MDVSNVAKEAGFIVSVSVTSRVFHEVIVPPEETATTQDDIGRLWNLLNVLRMEIRRGKPGQDRIDFYFLVQNKPGKLSRQALKALCHPGDNREPVIAVMFPDED